MPSCLGKRNGDRLVYRFLKASGKKIHVTNFPQFSSNPTFRANGARIRLRTLVLMRWIAIGGQTITILVVNYVLQYPFPFVLTLVTVGVSVLFNLFLWLRYPVSKQLSDTEAGLHLFYDALQLSVLLFLTGGLHNPFSFLIIAAAIISAAVLSIETTVRLIVVVLIFSSVLVFFHRPLPVPYGQHPIPHFYVYGIWSSLVVAMIFFSANVMRVAEERRRMTTALMETQMALARERRLSEVGGLAAAAAHELGTPLGTIALVAKELGREFPPDCPNAKDVELLLSQSERCRKILARLTLYSADGASPSLHRLPFMNLIEMSARSPRREGIEVMIEHAPGLAGESARAGKKTSAQPVVSHSFEITHGLKNIIENAMDFARSRVSIKADWCERDVVVEITDDGPGFSREILGSLGEPYVSTRRDAGGMGLGVFIAKTLLERTGAEIWFGNRKDGGARVAIAWPRRLFPDCPDGVDGDGDEMSLR